MTLDQHVPTTGFGGMVQWSRTSGTRHLFTAGTDWRWVDGDSNEDGRDAMTGLTLNLRRMSGGTQRSVGAFVQDMFTPVAAAHRDRERAGRSTGATTTRTISRPRSGRNADPEQQSEPARTSDTVASPRPRRCTGSPTGERLEQPRARRSAPHARTSCIGSSGSGPDADAGERGARTGASRRWRSGRERRAVRNLTVRATWFDNGIENPVANVTLSRAGITQQRQNLGRTRVRGVQTDVDYRLGTDWRIGGGYVFDVAKVTEDIRSGARCAARRQVHCPGPDSIGARCAWSYSNLKYATVAFDVEAIGLQFEDD